MRPHVSDADGPDLASPSSICPSPSSQIQSNRESQTTTRLQVFTNLSAPDAEIVERQTGLSGPHAVEEVGAIHVRSGGLRATSTCASCAKIASESECGALGAASCRRRASCSQRNGEWGTVATGRR